MGKLAGAKPRLGRTVVAHWEFTGDQTQRGAEVGVSLSPYKGSALEDKNFQQGMTDSSL